MLTRGRSEIATISKVLAIDTPAGQVSVFVVVVVVELVGVLVCGSGGGVGGGVGGDGLLSVLGVGC